MERSLRDKIEYMHAHLYFVFFYEAFRYYYITELDWYIQKRKKIILSTLLNNVNCLMS